MIPAARAFAGRLALGCGLAALAVVALERLGPAPAEVADRGLRGPLAEAEARAGASWRAPRIVAGAADCPRTAAALAASAGEAAPAWRCQRRGERLVVVDAAGAPQASAPLARGRALLGPLLAIVLVFLLRRPATALVIAVVAATLVGRPVGEGAAALLAVTRETFLGGDNQMVLLFTVAMLGMVHLGIDSGAYAALAARLAGAGRGHDARARRRTRLATVGLGLIVFFDDYANSLVVGGSMRAASDRAGISRAKLAYLVDATSASVAGVALVSTWVGFEVGLLGNFQGSFAAVAGSAYGLFVTLLPYRFYCLLTILAALLFAWSGRDFGPMRRAEARALARARDQPVAPADAARGRLSSALVPVGAVLAAVLVGDLGVGLLRAPAGADLIEVFIAGADAVGLRALAVGGLLGGAAAAWLAWRDGMAPRAVARSWAGGVAQMAPILVILVAAMAMRQVTSDAGAPTWIAAQLGDVSGAALPLASFLVAALVAFLTGSSWATMGILLPVVVPLAAPWGAAHPAWLLAATAAVLDGAIFGDHCSPLSDTTVMSSAAADVGHDEHVATQLPYALLGMVAAGAAGYVGTAYLDLGPWQALLAGALILLAGIWGLGRRPA
jgi:Na+/H+ antiporter NhaC